jgi:thymidylate kinase
LESKNYRVVSFEGGDQVGKGDAINFFSKKLIEQEGTDVVISSFPIYATPIGNTIKTLLKEGGEKFNLNHREELEVKMALFALNRLEFLEVFLKQDISEETLILFDRSAFSNALTIAYGGVRGQTLQEAEELVKKALNLDALLIDTLSLDNCVIQLVTDKEEWGSNRKGETDLHESPDVQKYATFVYSLYEGIIGDGWKRVYTTKEGQWRDREEIYSDILGFVIQRLGEIGRNGYKGHKFDVGIREIIESIYLGSKVDESLLREYIGSIENNDKETMYSTSIKVKNQICSSFENIVFTNESVREAFRAILRQYSKIEEVLEYNLGKKFVNKLEKAVSDE